MPTITRLLIINTLVVGGALVSFAALADTQGARLLARAHVREVAAVAQSLHAAGGVGRQDRNPRDISEALDSLQARPDAYAGALLGPGGELLAGGPAAAVSCLRAAGVPLPPRRGETGGFAPCGGGVHWAVVSAPRPGGALLVARQPPSDAAHARTRRMLALAAAGLALTGGAVLWLVLNHALARPLGELLRGVLSLTSPGAPRAVAVPTAPGDVHDLAMTFNQLVSRLDETREQLRREAAARSRLERELGQAETFAELGRLAGGLAHEIGSPLSVIAMRAEGILGDSRTSFAARRHAEEILEETDRVSELIRGMLHMARRDTLRGAPVDLSDLAGQVMARVRETAGRSDVRLELEAGTPVFVFGNASLLRHALLNLVVNAVHAVSGSPGERRVRLRVERPGDQIHAVVEDTGPGIAAEHLSHVFEAFFTTKEAAEGTGLGLAITRAIAEAHGGSVQPGHCDLHGFHMTLALPPCPESSRTEPVHTPVVPISRVRPGAFIR